MLTNDQDAAYDYIIQTFKTEPLFLLTGSAGVGKTLLTKYISQYYTKLGYNICAIAPTHKAKRVIENMLNEKRISPIPGFTVASILGKIKEHSYVGTKTFSKGNDNKFDMYSIFILDEVSMVANKDLRTIVDYITKRNKKLLIIGDIYQIPSPSAPFKIGEFIEKENSYIFNDPKVTKFELTEIVRQVKDSPILTLACYIRDNINNDINDIPYTNIISYDEAYIKFLEFYSLNTSCKMIAYTNHSVRKHNLEIRKALNYKDKFVIDDILTGYNNLGWPIFLENGMDYVIKKVIKKTHRIEGFDNLYGDMIDLTIMGTAIVVPNLFFIDVNHENNYDFINELILRGEKINQAYSTKTDFARYSSMKNKVIFIEDLYKYNHEIYTESNFKEKHALLFIKLDEVIKNHEIIESSLTEKINTSYDDIINKRLTDDKIIADSETLADKYKVIEKDIYYGYAITAHKSQGSSIDNVIVDDTDFNKIQDRYNYKYDKMEKRTREKNQLKYVAYTRAKHNLYIIRD